MVTARRPRVWQRRRVSYLCHVLVSGTLILIAASQSLSQSPNSGNSAQTSAAASSEDSIYQSGMSLTHQKRYDDALVQFRLLETQFPQHPQGFTGEAIVLALTGDSQKATDTLKKALEIDPNYWLARRELGILYWSAGLKQESADQLGPLAHLHPDDGPVNLILGQYEFEQKNYKKALAYFSRIPAEMTADQNLTLMGAEAQLHSGEEASAKQILRNLQTRPDLTAEVRFRLAWLLGQAGLSPEAVQEFNKLPPDYPDPFRRDYGLALAYFGTRDYQECIQTLKPLLARGINQSEIYSLLGVAEEKSGHTQEAYDTFRQGILQNPSNPQNYLNLATLSSQHDNFEVAAQVLTEGLARNPNAQDLLLSRGIAYTLAAHFADANKDYQRVIATVPDDYGAYLAWGISEQEAGNLDDAVKLFHQAIAREPKDPRSYCFLAETLMQKGVGPGAPDFQEAQRAMDTAISLEPHFAHAYADRAKLELAQGNTKKAIVDLERARSADPKSRQIAYALARAYQREGEKAKAAPLFKEVTDRGEEDSGQFAKDSLTETLTVVSGGPH
jgi:tetratricopeptide (TPR) repeat protein